MAKYKVDKKELSHLLNTYVANQDVRTLCETIETNPLTYAEQTEDLLRRGDSLGQDNLRLVAGNLGNLGASVLNTYVLPTKELTELYGGLVTVIAAGHMKEWGNLTQQLQEQVIEDKGSLQCYQFIPEFYESICKPNLTQMTTDAVNHAINYLKSKSIYRGTNIASKLLSHEECFGPKIDKITEGDITSFLNDHTDDDNAARFLCRKYRLTGITRVTPSSRAMSMQVAPIPGRVQPINISFPMGLPSRMPEVAARAADYLAGITRKV